MIVKVFANLTTSLSLKDRKNWIDSLKSWNFEFLWCATRICLLLNRFALRSETIVWAVDDRETFFRKRHFESSDLMSIFGPLLLLNRLNPLQFLFHLFFLQSMLLKRLLMNLYIIFNSFHLIMLLPSHFICWFIKCHSDIVSRLIRGYFKLSLYSSSLLRDALLLKEVVQIDKVLMEDKVFFVAFLQVFSIHVISFYFLLYCRVFQKGFLLLLLPRWSLNRQVWLSHYSLLFIGSIVQHKRSFPLFELLLDLITFYLFL